MIEPYNINNSNLVPKGNVRMGRNMMEYTFIFLVVLLTVWIFVSLIIWLIRKLFKIRESNKIWR